MMETRKKTSKKVKKLFPKEDQEQITLSTWLTKKGILFTASANGGSRHWLEGFKLKRMGVSAGFPDIFIPMPRKGFNGFFIELKRVQGGVVSDAQRFWIEQLTKNGYLAVVCYGFDSAKQKVMEYFDMVEEGKVNVS